MKGVPIFSWNICDLSEGVTDREWPTTSHRRTLQIPEERRDHHHHHHHHHHQHHNHHNHQHRNSQHRRSRMTIRRKFHYQETTDIGGHRVAVPGTATAVGCQSGIYGEMIDDEFDKYFARAALGRAVDDDDGETEGRRGSLPSATLKVSESSGCRRTRSCKYPARRKRSVSPRPSSPAALNGSPTQRPTSLLLDNGGPNASASASTSGLAASASSALGGDVNGSDDSGKNLLSDNYVHESTLRAPSPGMKCHSAPHSRSSSWKKSRRPRAGSRHEDLMMLETRPRTGSVPLEETVISKLERLRLLQSDDVCPVRSFKLSSKGLINRGDSFKRKSEQSVASEGAGSTGAGAPQEAPVVAAEGADRSRAVSVNSAESSKASSSTTSTPLFRVLILGDHGVGKTALLHQFMTSEYMGATDTSFDNESEMTVSVLLDGEETTMDFIDVAFEENFQNYGDVDAYVIVYSITERSSFQHAVELLGQIQARDDQRKAAVIMVANKSELVRSRQIGDDEVKEICEMRDTKYIEVSAVLNHKVDELLVGIVSQIRLNPKRVERRRRQTEEKSRESSCVSSAKGLLGKLFRKTQYVSKSCDNLMVL